jgi:restriction system protein
MMQNTYAVTIEHPQQGKQQKLTGRNTFLVQQRAKLQLAQDEPAAQSSANLVATTQELINARNQTAQQRLFALHKLLNSALQRDARIDWQKFKITRPQTAAKPTPPVIDKPTLFKLPARPVFNPAPQREQFYSQPSLLGKLLKPIKTKQEQLAEAAYQQALQNYQTAKEQIMQRWQVRYTQIEAQNAKELERYNQRMQSAQQTYEADLKQWLAIHHAHTQINTTNAQIDDYQAAYLRQEASAVLDYCEMVLSDSPYPEGFTKQFHLDYLPDEKLLIVNYGLPPLTQMPNLQKIIGIKNTNLIHEVYLSDKEIKQLYQDTIYQIVLRNFYELFTADTSQALGSISFNAYIGNPAPQTYIVRLQSTKANFSQLDLAQLAPNSAFEQLASQADQFFFNLAAIS